jgi:hypothetical protein
MVSKERDITWLQGWVNKYHSEVNGMCEAVDDFDDIGKLGQGFMSIDKLDEINMGGEMDKRLTYINAGLYGEQRHKMYELLRGFIDCCAWTYKEMPGLSRDLVEHVLPIKKGFRPFKQALRNYSPELLGRIKEEIERLLEAKFIWTCWYADWVSNIVLVEKKNSGKIRICVDFCNLNQAMPKDEYPMPVADDLINKASGHKMISFLDGNAGYNQVFMADEDISKTAFRCPGFVGLLMVMTFGLKNAGATYQRAMNLIFHDLLGTILEVHIDNIVIKSASFDEHLANLRTALERMRKYNLKMNPLKCAFGVTAGKFLGFIVHEKRNRDRSWEGGVYKEVGKTDVQT